MVFKKINSDIAIARIPETESITIIVRDRYMEGKTCERWVAATCSKEDLKKLLDELH